MARSITTRSTNPKIMDDNIKILDDALAIASAPPAENVVYDNTDSGLTADDVQAAIDEIGVIYGSNSNGKYLKFTNGTLICWKQVQYNDSVNDTSGALYASKNINLGSFPIAFTEVPNIQVSSSALGIMTGARDATASSAGICNIYRTTSVSTLTCVVRVFAIGTWK